MTKANLVVSFNRAMIGTITPHVRAITIAWTEDSLISCFYFDRAVTEFDEDIANQITTEVIADFPNIMKEETKVFHFNGDHRDIPFLEAWIFLRKEDEVW
jgi:hypothetical protein